MEIKTRALILKVSAFQDRGKIVTLFTEEIGLIPTILMGLTSKSHQRLALTTVFAEVECVIKKGRSDLWLVKEGSLLYPHHLLRKNQERLFAAAQIAADLLESQLPEKNAPKLFLLAKLYFSAIEKMDNPELLSLSFRLKLLHHEGMINPECIENKKLHALLVLKKLSGLEGMQVSDLERDTLKMIWSETYARGGT